MGEFEDLEGQLRADLEHNYRDLAESIGIVNLRLREWWSTPLMPWFTNHGPEHSQRVAVYAGKLTELISHVAKPLSPLERYILHIAALLHDVGMQAMLKDKSIDQLVPTDYQAIRHEHPKQTFDVITTDPDSFGLPSNDDRLVKAIADVAMGHGTVQYPQVVKRLQVPILVRGEGVRGALLVALLLLADELDLHYQRVDSIDPRQAKLPSISIAHQFKHQCVSGIRISQTGDGSITFHIIFDFPRELQKAEQDEVIRWIVVKLREQIAMTRPAFTRANVRINPAIGISAKADRNSPLTQDIEDALRHIRAENARRELINYRPERARLNWGNDDQVLVIQGDYSASVNRQRTGREDLLRIAALDSAASGEDVRISYRLRNNCGGTISDVLEEWVSGNTHSEEPRMVERQRRAERLSALVQLARHSSRIVLVVSSLDLLTRRDKDWFASRAMLELMSANPRLKLMLSAARVDVTWPASVQVRTIQLGPPASDEAEQFLQQFGDERYSHATTKGDLDYDQYKAVVMSLEVDLQGVR